MLNRLEQRLQHSNSDLFSRLQNTAKEVELLLQKYSANFPQYTDHSINHTRLVFDYASDLLTDSDIENLNDDEIYILSMACYLHDIGMCIPEERIKDIENTEEIQEYRKSNTDKPVQDYIRDIHHILSYRFIEGEQKMLGIPNEYYTNAIGLVAQGHRKVDLGNIDIYKPRCSVKSGKSFVCLPYLAAIIRLADELDITNIRTPRLLTKYYMPDNEISIREWNKHISTTTVNLFDDDDTIRFKVKCTDQNVYAALQEQFQKVENTLFYCQKIIKNISNTGKRKFSLDYIKLNVDYEFMGFDPKGIRFSFNVTNVVNAFVGEDLYEDKMASLREVIQNSIDTCRYKKVLLGKNYQPSIEISITDDVITISDNGIGMDEFIIENYFGKLASSYYQEDNVKKDYEAIGQFGIGVFSYFMIAEYIDIETKTDKSDTLKFRIDKDPNNYFHFFDKTSRKDSGTTIDLYLKKNVDIDLKKVEDYLLATFLYIEFPITIKHSKDQYQLKKSEFKVDVSKKIKESIRFEHLEKINSIQYYSLNLDNEILQGNITMLYDKDLVFDVVSTYLDSNQFYNKRKYVNNNYSISQKGVYVCDASEHRYLSNVIAKLNLKSKININLSRHAFSEDNVLEGLIHDINLKLIKSFFNDVVLKMNSEYFVQKSFNFFDSVPYKYLVDDLLFVDFIIDNNRELVTVKELLERKYNEFALVEAKLVNESLNQPVIIRPKRERKITGNNSDLLIFNKLFRNLYVAEYYMYEKKYNIQFTLISDEKNYKSIDILNSIIGKRGYDYLKNKDFIAFDLLNYDAIMNLNHIFINLILDNYKKIKESQNFKKISKILDEVFGIIEKSVEWDSDNLIENIKVINRLINSISSDLNFEYEFSKKDFC